MCIERHNNGVLTVVSGVSNSEHFLVGRLIMQKMFTQLVLIALILQSSSVCLVAAVEEHAQEEIEEEMLVIFVFFAVLLGAAVRFILARSKLDLPYTVVLFVLGFVIGEIASRHKGSAYSHSIQSWQRIKPELIFYCFLPLLIFGDAQSLNWHHVKASFGQSLLIAVPGVLMGAFLTAVFMYFSFPFGWSWYLCMLFGSILSDRYGGSCIDNEECRCSFLFDNSDCRSIFAQ